MTGTMPFLLMAAAIFGMLAMGVIAFSGPSTGKAQSRRLEAVKGRHIGGADVATQTRRILTQQDTRFDLAITRLLPNPAQLRKRIDQTGKDWTLGRYMLVNAALVALVVFLGGIL